MLAAYAARVDPSDPLAGLVVGDRPEPEAREHWTTVTVRAASLNHHDLWSLRGVGLPAERLPMILGTDAAGVTPDGRDVVVHGVIGATGHGVGPTEGRSLLSERHPGTFAERVAAPTWNLLPKPPEISFTEASCLPTAWLTAYRMLFTSAGAAPGDRVLVQGAGGGVSTAAVLLGAAAGEQHAVGGQPRRRQARGLDERDPGRLVQQVPRRDRDALGEGARVPLGGQAAGLVGTHPVPGRADHRVHDDLAPVRCHTRRVGAQDHRQPLRGQADAAQRPQVVVVERRRPHGHRGPVLACLGLRPVADLQAGERVVRVQAGGVGGEHRVNLRRGHDHC